MSGIYIPDVSLPGEEDLWIVVSKDGSFTFNVGEGEGWQDGKQKAVPVPTHGRLGDLDKLEQMFADIDHAPYSGFDGSEPFYSAEDAAQIIRLATTIIPAEPLNEEVNE